MLDKNPETRIGVPDIKVGEPEVLGWAGPQKTGLGFPFWGTLHRGHLCIGLGFGVFGLWTLKATAGGMPGSLARRCLSPVALTLPALCSTVASLGDQEWGGAPSLGGGALHRGGGDRGGGEELSQAHPQLDHGGKRMGVEGADSWEGRRGRRGSRPRLALCWALWGAEGFLVGQPQCWAPEATVPLEAHRNKVTLFSLVGGRPGGVARRANDLSILPSLSVNIHHDRQEKHFLPSSLSPSLSSFLTFIELLLFSRHWTRCQGHDREKA